MPIQAISFHCVLKNKQGRIISTTFNKNVLTHSQSEQDSLRPLGEALKDIQKGEKREVCLSADQAYGFYNPSLVLVRSLEQLSLTEPVKIGDRVVYVTEGQRHACCVTELSGDSITLDANHPLAGQDLVFEIEALEVREATAEEIGEPEGTLGPIVAH